MLPPFPLRIVRRLAQLYTEHSGTRLKQAVTDGQVTVNGVKVDDPGAFVGEGDVVVWDRNRRVERRVRTSLEVLHEDADTIAVVKPAGLLTHATEAKEKDTLLSRVSSYVARRHRHEGRPYVGIVHRLDKETSGILAFALGKDAMETLQAQLRAHTMDRRYQAVVEGRMQGESGVFAGSIVDQEGERRRHVAREGEHGERAVTEWKVLERFPLATLVEVRLRTGRTHQIRVHFAHAGHPLVGDPVYRDRALPPFPVPFHRQALHAGQLGWKTPRGESVSVSAPPPEDFQDLVLKLRKTQKPVEVPEAPMVGERPERSDGPAAAARPAPGARRFARPEPAKRPVRKGPPARPGGGRTPSRPTGRPPARPSGGRPPSRPTSGRRPRPAG